MSSMDASHVKAALRDRWPSSENVTIEEAALDTMRQGRKADFVAISCWQSRGYEVDVVEVKVSYGDWQRERDKPSKADSWWKAANRFWVACPAKLVERIRPELPSGWGLLAVSEAGAAKALVPAIRTDRETMSWPQTIALLRSAQNAGLGSLRRAESKGFTRGFEAGKAEAPLVAQSQAASDELAAGLRDLLETFEKETGYCIHGRWQLARLAVGFAGLSRAIGGSPTELAAAISFIADSMERHTTQTRDLAKLVASTFHTEDTGRRQ